MIRPACIIAAVAAFGLTASHFQDSQESAAADPPPMPFFLGKEQFDAGNPLPAILQLLELENAYHEAGMTRMFHDALATRLSIAGDTQGATRLWSELHDCHPAAGPLLDSPLDAYQSRDAVDVIIEKADNHRVIMIGEEHVQPQTRCILKPLLTRLWDKGFRYFAAETFSADLTDTINAGYTRNDTGFYTRDPVFAEAVNEALRLGYTLVPYERTERPDFGPDAGPMDNQNHRERIQAEHLKQRIFDADPDAKALVWAGRAHVSEETGEVPGGAVLKPMAYVFKEITGLDPFSVYLPSGVEQATPAHEFSFYRYATHHGWVERPTIFTREDGSTFGWSGDAMVFFPRVRMVTGRPDWLARDLGRVPVAIQRELLVAEGHQLVQAYHVDDVQHAIPVDQVLIAPGDPIPVLMLPEKGPYWVRSIDSQNTVRGPLEVPGSG